MTNQTISTSGNQEPTKNTVNNVSFPANENEVRKSHLKSPNEATLKEEEKELAEDNPNFLDREDSTCTASSVDKDEDVSTLADHDETSVADSSSRVGGTMMMMEDTGATPHSSLDSFQYRPFLSLILKRPRSSSVDFPSNKSHPVVFTTSQSMIMTHQNSSTSSHEEPTENAINMSFSAKENRTSRLSQNQTPNEAPLEEEEKALVLAEDNPNLDREDSACTASSGDVSTSSADQDDETSVDSTMMEEDTGFITHSPESFQYRPFLSIITKRRSSSVDFPSKSQKQTPNHAALEVEEEVVEEEEVAEADLSLDPGEDTGTSSDEVSTSSPDQDETSVNSTAMMEEDTGTTHSLESFQYRPFVSLILQRPRSTFVDFPSNKSPVVTTSQFMIMTNQNSSSSTSQEPTTKNTVIVSSPANENRECHLSQNQAKYSNSRNHILRVLALKKSHMERCIQFAEEVKIHEITPLRKACIDDMFYSEDALADMRYEAFMEKCGLDPDEFE
jgi:hypothetical protein